MNQKAIDLFERHFKETVKETKEIGPHGSARRIIRLISQSRSVIGVENEDSRENRAFITFSKHFRSFSLPAPEIYAESADGKIYLQEDLGDATLFDVLTRERGAAAALPASVEKLYEEALSLLPRFQVEAGATLDYSICHKDKVFSREMMLRDMHYFRDQYLKRMEWKYDSAALDREFEQFAGFLQTARADFFMYRDFQSRNIMVRDGKLHFIDYQGGCRGPLQYDVASLLYQAAARLPDDARKRLLNVYLGSLKRYSKIDRPEFLNYFYAFVYLRIMQVLGTYGLRGLQEKKQYFIESIQFALGNLKRLYQHEGLPVKMPEFERFINSIDMSGQPPVRLKIAIFSVSYKQETGVPAGAHGGGFVFDCRCLPNPGREEAYKNLSGMDQPVITFLASKPEVEAFFSSVTKVVEQSVAAYLARSFSSLSVTFGCTGGQHRSVYLAERLGKHLLSKFDVDVEVRHLSKHCWPACGVK